MNTTNYPESNQSALLQSLSSIPNPPQSEKDCIESVKIIESLTKIGHFDSQTADRLQSILFFIPQGSYREIFWPRTWIKAVRILRAYGYIDKLKEVASSKKTHYLSVIGAIALAQHGIFEGDIEETLRNKGDYFLLTTDEKAELDSLLAQLDANQT
ncbi:MAG TPA: hypothetical protein VFS21_27405 [Roseiflexaceae bacterium]|nr:hypothetical protein [Roseiflexaceae bacterium]